MSLGCCVAILSLALQVTTALPLYHHNMNDIRLTSTPDSCLTAEQPPINEFTTQVPVYMGACLPPDDINVALQRWTLPPISSTGPIRTNNVFCLTAGSDSGGEGSDVGFSWCLGVEAADQQWTRHADGRLEAADGRCLSLPGHASDDSLVVELGRSGVRLGSCTEVKQQSPLGAYPYVLLDKGGQLTCSHHVLNVYPPYDDEHKMHANDVDV